MSQKVSNLSNPIPWLLMLILKSPKTITFSYLVKSFLRTIDISSKSKLKLFVDGGL